MGEAEKLLPLRVTVWTASSRQRTPLCSLGSRSMAWSRNNRMSLSISCRVMDNNRQEARKMEVSVAAAPENLTVQRLKHLKATVHRLRIPEHWVRISAAWTIYILSEFSCLSTLLRMNAKIVPYNSPLSLSPTLSTIVYSNYSYYSTLCQL